MFRGKKEEKILYKIHIKGRVQGVGYRWSAVREARSLGITGFVRNQPDGSVYIEAEGTRRRLESYLDWCRVGPRLGHVDSVLTDVYPAIGYREFKVEY